MAYLGLGVLTQPLQLSYTQQGMGMDIDPRAILFGGEMP